MTESLIDLTAFDSACDAVEDKYMLTDETASFHDVGGLRGYVYQVISFYEQARQQPSPDWEGLQSDPAKLTINDGKVDNAGLLEKLEQELNIGDRIHDEFERGYYKAKAQACYVVRQHMEAKPVGDDLSELKAEIKYKGLFSTRQRIERLSGALRPFVELAKQARGFRHEPESSCEWRIKAADLYAAEAALTSQDGGANG